MPIDVKVTFQSGETIPDTREWPLSPGATFVCEACCDRARLFQVEGADGLPAIELFCTARKHPSVLLRDGKVIGTSA